MASDESVPHSMPADELDRRERSVCCQCRPNKEWIFAANEGEWPRLVVRHYGAAEVAARDAIEVPF